MQKKYRRSNKASKQTLQTQIAPSIRRSAVILSFRHHLLKHEWTVKDNCEFRLHLYML